MGVFSSRGKHDKFPHDDDDDDNEDGNICTYASAKLPRSMERRNSSILKNEAMFNDIDEHVRKTPISTKTSMKKLVEYLIKPAKTELEKVRAIYKYIQLNISYDVESYRNGNVSTTDSDDVLRYGKALCSGYSNLFADMCTIASVTVECIHGFAKGLNFNAQRRFELSDYNNHEWNAVLVDGEWRFVDCTWGTGYVNSRLEYERFNNEYYFLSDPKDFIRSHFPYMDWDMERSHKWQLLMNPVDLDTFNNSVKSSVFASENGIQFLSHDNVNVHLSEKTEIYLGFSNLDITIYAYLLDYNDREVGNCLPVVKDGYEHTVYVTAPSTGQFNLEIYGTVTNSTVLNLYVTYIVHSE